MKAASSAESSLQGAQLAEHLRLSEKYGATDFKELENGRICYYGEMTPPEAHRPAGQQHQVGQQRLCWAENENRRHQYPANQNSISQSEQRNSSGIGSARISDTERFDGYMAHRSQLSGKQVEPVRSLNAQIAGVIGQNAVENNELKLKLENHGLNLPDSRSPKIK